MHSGKTKDPSDNTSNEMAGNGNAETYADYLEQKLAKVLSEVHGVGQTEVMITMASSSEKILGADSESESESVKESDSQGGKQKYNSESEFPDSKSMMVVKQPGSALM